MQIPVVLTYCIGNVTPLQPFLLQAYYHLLSAFRTSAPWYQFSSLFIPNSFHFVLSTSLHYRDGICSLLNMLLVQLSDRTVAPPRGACRSRCVLVLPFGMTSLLNLFLLYVICSYYLNSPTHCVKAYDLSMLSTLPIMSATLAP